MRVRSKAGRVATIAASCAFSVTALGSQAAPSVATISACEFSNGVVIAPCRIAYRTYGTLNAQRSNVVLVPTWLPGRSEDWLAYGLLGPQGIVDTTAFYTIVVDALGNGQSQSPSSTDASKVKGFEALTIADMVRSQHRLLSERLGISRLHAVMGASMGEMQAFEWAVRFPAFVDRIVPIIGSPRGVHQVTRDSIARTDGVFLERPHGDSGLRRCFRPHDPRGFHGDRLVVWSSHDLLRDAARW